MRTEETVNEKKTGLNKGTTKEAAYRENDAQRVVKVKKTAQDKIGFGRDTIEEDNKRNEDDKMEEEVETQSKAKLKVSQIRLSSAENDTTIIDKICQQNNISKDSAFSMKILKIIERRDRRNFFDIYMEVDIENHKKIVREGVVRIGHSRGKAWDHMSINIKRCFKCWRYNHTGNECKSNVICVKCAGNHSAVRCMEVRDEVKDKDNMQCNNCKTANNKFNLNIDSRHKANDNNCPCYSRIYNMIKKRTD